jgi:virulence-associated protein VapD
MDIESKLEDSVYSRRFIAFDLKQKMLDKYYPKANSNAYKEIEIEMFKLDFIHRQGSGYESINKLINDDFINIIRELNDTLPWLLKCSSKFDGANIAPVTYNFLEILSQKENREKTIDAANTVNKENTINVDALTEEEKIVLDEAELDESGYLLGGALSEKYQQINAINKSNINNTNINDKTNDAELDGMDDHEITLQEESDNTNDFGLS